MHQRHFNLNTRIRRKVDNTKIQQLHLNIMLQNLKRFFKTQNPSEWHRIVPQTCQDTHDKFLIGRIENSKPKPIRRD